MAHARSERKTRDLMAAQGLMAQFITALGAAFVRNGGNELEAYKFLNGTGYLSFDSMAQLSMKPHQVVMPPANPESLSEVASFRILEVVVDTGRKWRKLVRAAAPGTIGGYLGAYLGGNPIWRIDRHFGYYPAQRYRQSVILIRFSKMQKRAELLEWAKKAGLVFVNPYEICAIGEREHFLAEEIKADVTVYTFETLRKGQPVRYRLRIQKNGYRELGVDRTEYGSDADSWMAFRPRTPADDKHF